MAKRSDPPVVLIKWYDFTKWLLDRVDSFPKNQRFMFGQRVTDHAVDILELLVEASYSSRKVLTPELSERQFPNYLNRRCKKKRGIHAPVSSCLAGASDQCLIEFGLA